MIDARVAVGVGVALALLGVAGATRGGGPERSVTIDGMKFEPAVLTIRRGDTVRWVNRDLVAHTATAAGRFDSGQIAAGAAWEFTARTAGRFDYVCALHPTMKATLVVE